MLKKMGIVKGVNLGGWLSQCDYSEERLNGFITEPDVEKIATWGVDHVRIPVDYNVLEDDNGGYIETGFKLIDNALSWCEKYGLKVVLDLHKTAGFSFDNGEKEEGFFSSAALQERFCRLWEELAKHYGKLSDKVVFELLNEVTDQSYIDTWNRVANECIKRIRVYAPDTLILVGSYHNNSAPAVKDLDPPYDDKVVYNFHCYDPLEFTHQYAYWVQHVDVNKKMSYAESGATAEYFEQQFASAIEAAVKNGTVLYCGEYGVIDKADPEDALEWLKAINSVFVKHGISRCIWSYKEMDFGLTDPRLDAIRDEIIKYL